MVKIYTEMKIFAFVKFVIAGIIGLFVLLLLFYMLFLNHITSVLDLFVRTSVVLPLLIGMYWVFTKFFGYMLSDEGIARCRVNEEGCFYINYIKWKDVIRINYKPARVKMLDFDQVIVHSIYGNKIFVDDSQCGFQEILYTIQNRTAMNSKRFIINDSHKTIVFDNSDDFIKNKLSAKQKYFLQNENVRTLPNVKLDE